MSVFNMKYAKCICSRSKHSKIKFYNENHNCDNPKCHLHAKSFNRKLNPNFYFVQVIFSETFFLMIFEYSLKEFYNRRVPLTITRVPASILIFFLVYFTFKIFSCPKLPIL